MPPKNKFSREQIIEAAFEIAKEEGIDSITIRKVAKNLGSSIAPIYVNFKDVGELKKDVISKIYEISNSILDKQNTGDIFLNIGIASIKFAREYSLIFKELMLKGDIYLEDYDQKLGNRIIEFMKQDKELEIFSYEELKLILLKMRIFQVGLSIMVTNESFMKDFSEEKVIQLLKDTGIDIINGTKFRK